MEENIGDICVSEIMETIFGGEILLWQNFVENLQISAIFCNMVINR